MAFQLADLFETVAEIVPNRFAVVDGARGSPTRSSTNARRGSRTARRGGRRRRRPRRALLHNSVDLVTVKAIRRSPGGQGRRRMGLRGRGRVARALGRVAVGTIGGVAVIQDQIPNNYCWGCGADNEDGLQLKSHWEGDAVVATWTAHAEHAAGPRHLVNGGILATVLDCHGVCTAIADAYRNEGRAIGSDPEIWFATAAMRVEYLRPTPIEATLELRASVVERGDRRTTVECVLAAAGKDRARAVVEAVRVPDDWRHGRVAEQG
jgi:acyl-coenzyme A thioesterase PaaI-like protein